MMLQFYSKFLISKSGTQSRAFLNRFKEKITVKHTLVMGGKMKD